MRPRTPARRGINVLVVVILASIMAAAGVFYMLIAQQSGRAAHWYVLAQQAFGVAETGVREALVRLAELNSQAEARRAGQPGQAYLRVFEAMAQASAGRFTVMNSGTPSSLTTATSILLKGFKEFSPSLEVTVEVVPATSPLVDASLGLPALSGEGKGVLRLTARGEVRHALGQRVNRVITVEKDYKIVSGLPDLLGRFVLFAGGRSASIDINTIPNQVDEGTFNSSVKPSDPHPLVVQAGRSFELIKQVPDPDVPAETLIERDQSALTTASPDFLDRQGWIFLGPAEAGSWPLHVAHGFSRYGESFLFHGRRLRSPYSDSGFQTRLAGAWNSQFGCSISFPPPTGGLWHHQHGYATNFEVVGLVDGAGAVQDDTGAPTKVPHDVGVLEAGQVLRLPAEALLDLLETLQVCRDQLEGPVFGVAGPACAIDLPESTAAQQRHQLPLADPRTRPIHLQQF